MQNNYKHWMSNLIWIVCAQAYERGERCKHTRFAGMLYLFMWRLFSLGVPLRRQARAGTQSSFKSLACNDKQLKLWKGYGRKPFLNKFCNINNNVSTSSDQTISKHVMRNAMGSHFTFQSGCSTFSILFVEKYNN